MDLWTQASAFIHDHPAASAGLAAAVAIPLVLAAPAVATVAAFIGGMMGIGEALGSDEDRARESKKKDK